MSCDFYFKQWKLILARLEALIQTDLEFQTEEAHDQELSDAVQRVNLILVQYMTVYNDAMECVQNNLQVQKATYMEEIVEAVASRILELKYDLEELECSPFHYLGSALITNNQTYNPEMTTILKTKRTPIVKEAIETAFLRVKEKKEAPEEPEVVEEKIEEETNDENIDDIFLKLEAMRKTFMMALKEDEDENVENGEKEESISDEDRVRRDYLNLIKAHEKLRQLTRSLQLKKFKREAWERELLGTARPPARYELRQKAAKLIKKIIRAYLEMKRKRIRECKLEQILGMTICKHPQVEKLIKIEEKPANLMELFEKYEKECKSHKENITEHYMKTKLGAVSEDFRDRIRDWFYEWFESVQFIHKIPKDGSIAIFREEVPDPEEWLKEYEESMNQKNKGTAKTPQQIKYEKKAAKELEWKLKREELRRQKAEAATLKKMRKSPKMHPGYFYKQSKKANHLLETINSYHKTWDDYDAQEIPEVKRKYIEELNKEDVYMNAQLEILQEVDADMQIEYTTLNNALKEDYKNNDMVMPVQTAEARHKKKLKRVKAVRSERIVDKLEALAMQGFIVDYPDTKLDDYFGDPNFIGDDLRRSILPTFPQSYEIRAHWWDQCHRVAHSSQKILLFGPEDSGKITLVYALASMNDAVLFEIDPVKFPTELLTPTQLKRLTKNVLFCAKAVQPSVIYIRHVQKLFYTKEPIEEANLQLRLIKRFFIAKLLKEINKQDKITVIGTCSDPWLARSSQLLKLFPIVVLLPNVTYSLAVLLLKNWVDRYSSIPSTFNVSNLAYMLQKYSYGFITRTLEDFMSDERLTSIAVHGLTPMNVYNYILESDFKETLEYERYLKWYFEKTPTGKKEKQHFDGQVDFREAVAELKAKQEKKTKLARRSAPSSTASSKTAL